MYEIGAKRLSSLQCMKQHIICSNFFVFWGRALNFLASVHDLMCTNPQKFHDPGAPRTMWSHIWLKPYSPLFISCPWIAWGFTVRNHSMWKCGYLLNRRSCSSIPHAAYASPFALKCGLLFLGCHPIWHFVVMGSKSADPVGSTGIKLSPSSSRSSSEMKHLWHLQKWS